MNEEHYMFHAQPGAVFRIGWHWLEVIKPIGLLNLRIFTSFERFHDLDVSVATNLFPHIWVGLEFGLHPVRQAITLCVPHGTSVLARSLEMDAYQK